MESNTEVLLDPRPDKLGGMDATCKDLFSEVLSVQDALRGSLTKCLSEKKSCERKSSCSDTRSVHLLKEHIYTLQNLREMYVKRFIIDLRDEIRVMWEKCCYGDSQKSLFRSYHSESFTDDLLIEHENELKCLKEYYDTHKELYKLVSKREKLWKEKLTFENPPDGCSRFENRGGTLIKELKRYQVVEKQLPVTEKEIKIKIKSWEKLNKTRFQMHDLQYVDYIETQKQEYKVQQEAKRAAKKAAKHEELLAEMSSNGNCVKKSSLSSNNVSKVVSKEVKQESLKELMRPTSASLLKSRNFSTPSARSRLSVSSPSLKRSAPASKVMDPLGEAVPLKVTKLDLSDNEKSPAGTSVTPLAGEENSKENARPSKAKTPRPESVVKIRPLLQSSAMKRKLQRRSLTIK